MTTASLAIAGQPFCETPGGIRLMVRLTPNAAFDGLQGLVADSDGRPLLAIRLKARPVEGAANTALVGYLAKVLNLRKSDVVIVSGETARIKGLNITRDRAALAQRLTALMAGAG